jgi:hypothetical protein
MFTDMSVSADLNREYQEKEQEHKTLHFSILVLTAGSWPLTQQAASQFNLPAVLESSVTKFTSFYSGRYNGRKLTWLFHLSKAEVLFHQLGKRYELSASLFQAAILLLFNEGNSLTLEEIEEQSALNDVEIRRAIKVRTASLAKG